MKSWIPNKVSFIYLFDIVTCSQLFLQTKVYSRLMLNIEQRYTWCLIVKWGYKSGNKDWVVQTLPFYSVIIIITITGKKGTKDTQLFFSGLILLLLLSFPRFLYPSFTLQFCHFLLFLSSTPSHFNLFYPLFLIPSYPSLFTFLYFYFHLPSPIMVFPVSNSVR